MCSPLLAKIICLVGPSSFRMMFIFKGKFYYSKRYLVAKITLTLSLLFDNDNRHECTRHYNQELLLSLLELLVINKMSCFKAIN